MATIYELFKTRVSERALSRSSQPPKTVTGQKRGFFSLFSRTPQRAENAPEADAFPILENPLSSEDLCQECEGSSTFYCPSDAILVEKEAVEGPPVGLVRASLRSIRRRVGQVFARAKAEEGIPRSEEERTPFSGLDDELVNPFADHPPFQPSSSPVFSEERMLGRARRARRATFPMASEPSPKPRGSSILTRTFRESQKVGETEEQEDDFRGNRFRRFFEDRGTQMSPGGVASACAPTELLPRHVSDEPSMLHLSSRRYATVAQNRLFWGISGLFDYPLTRRGERRNANH